MNWFRRLIARLEHKPENCSTCRDILHVLADRGPSFGLELIAEKPKRIKHGVVYVHLGQLEDLGLVERCGVEWVGADLWRFKYRMAK